MYSEASLLEADPAPPAPDTSDDSYLRPGCLPLHRGVGRGCSRTGTVPRTWLNPGLNHSLWLSIGDPIYVYYGNECPPLSLSYQLIYIFNR